MDDVNGPIPAFLQVVRAFLYHILIAAFRSSRDADRRNTLRVIAFPAAGFDAAWFAACILPGWPTP